MGVPSAVPFGQGSYVITAYMSTVSTAGQIYVVVPRSGFINKVWSVLNGAIITADAVITVKLNGTSVGTITITQSGSAAGDVDSLGVSLDVVEGDTLEFETNGASGNAVAVQFTCDVWY